MKYIDLILDHIAKSKKIQFRIFLAVLTMLSLLLIYYWNYMNLGHDFYFHFRRFNSLIRALFDGSFPIYLDDQAIYGYGYMSNTFYSDFMLIPFAFVAKYTDVVTALKTMIFVMTMLCGLFTYKLVNTVYKNTLAASIAALLFTFCNYRLLDIYFRFAIGEVLSFTFLPLVLLGLYYIIKGDYKRKWYVIAIGFACMIFSHILSTVLTAIIVLIFMAIYNRSLIKEPKRIVYLCLAGVATTLITIGFVLPMIEQMMANIYFYDVSNWNVPSDSTIGIYKLVLGMTSALSLPSQDFMPRLGLIPLVILGFRLFIKTGDDKLFGLSRNLVIVGMCMLFAITPFFPWDMWPLSKLELIQFPWRLFEFVTLLFVIAGAFYLSQAVKSYRAIAILCLMSIVVLSMIVKSESDNVEAYNFRENKLTAEIDDKGFDVIISGLEYLPAEITDPSFFRQRGLDLVETKNSDTEISNFMRKERIASLDLKTDQAESLILPLLYYKGYKATLNGADVGVGESDMGLIEIPVNKSGHVEVYYAGTTIQKITFWISIASIITLCIFIFVLNKRYSPKKEYN